MPKVRVWSLTGWGSAEDVELGCRVGLFIAKREGYETRPPTGQCHGFVVASVALLLPRVRM
jgi:hypothetical protein